MRNIFICMIILVIAGCESSRNADQDVHQSLSALFDHYYDTRMQLFPLEATTNGDNRYNDLLPADFTESYRAKLKSFYSGYLDSINRYDRSKLDENDQISYDIFKYEMQTGLEGLSNHYMSSSAVADNDYIPFDQFWGVPLTLGQAGSGTGVQPFKTVKDYDNWVKRASAFEPWSDSAIAAFRRGMTANYVLPKALVLKIIPQLEAMVVTQPEKSIFYGPVQNFPKDFSDADKKRLTATYDSLIGQKIIPSYKKLAEFLKNEYLSKARTSTGFNGLPGGDQYYKFLVHYWTTTNKTPEEIYQTGLSEVKRIRGIMDSVKNAVGFKGSLNEFFEYMKTDKRFMPYKTPQDVLNAFEDIHKRMEPNLKKMYGRVPKSKFEIRQTEAFRAASASAEYNPGSPDGSRPGIFYVPILDATKFNTTSGMESLFLHEAIPGHHYQMSLQMENDQLPKFRRFLWYGAYGEGYALYCESLGKELGLYTDPYQYMGALGDEIHRAIRLVVDVGMHTRGMTREQAIRYMTDNEAISEEGATAEIERYMAIAGQALSYKIGALKIRELRNKYQQQLGSRFRLSDFHDEFLKDGCMPLSIAEQKMDSWASHIK